MTCEQFYDRYMVDWIDTYIQESHYTESFSADICFKMLQKAAKAKVQVLSDLDTFDYETFFYDVYNVTEKGLS